MLEIELAGVMAALGSAASWAVGAFLFKTLGEVLPPVAMTLAKGVSSLALLGFVMVLTGPEPLGRGSLMLLAVSGLLGIALGDTFFFEALQGLGPQPLLVLAMLGQVLTVVMAVLFLGETPTPSVWIGVLLVVSGAAVVLQGTLAGEKRATALRGVSFGLLSVLCMCASNVAAKAALEARSDTIQATFVRMLAGTSGVFIFGMASKRLTAWVMPFRDRGLASLFALSVCVVTFGGFWLSIVAYKYAQLSVASSLTSTEPVFALALAVIFLKERVTLRAVGGTLATVTGVAFLCVPEIDRVLEGIIARL